MGAVLRLRPGEDPPRWAGGGANDDDELPCPTDELPFILELLHPASGMALRVLALVSNVSVGFGAYYAAVTAYPDHHLRLRTKDRTVIQTPGAQGWS